MSGSKRRRMLSVEEIMQALDEIKEQCGPEVALQRAVLVGGVALQFHGSDRFTADIDIAATSDLPLPMGRRLSFGGFTSEAPNGVPVDVIVRTDDYAELYTEAIRYGQKLPEVPLPVVGPEYAVAMKMAAHRPKDTADIDILLRLENEAGEPLVDIVKARRIVKRFLGPYAVDALDAMVREAAWRKGVEG